MPPENEKLSTEFLEQQRIRLKTLYEQLGRGEAKTAASERASQERREGQTQDAGEKSVTMAQHEIDQALFDVDKRRLNDIERAIQKIAENTYGLSDISGEPIPKARLNATPEAVFTVQEEAFREKRK